MIEHAHKHVTDKEGYIVIFHYMCWFDIDAIFDHCISRIITDLYIYIYQ